MADAAIAKEPKNLRFRYRIVVYERILASSKCLKAEIYDIYVNGPPVDKQFSPSLDDLAILCKNSKAIDPTQPVTVETLLEADMGPVTTYAPITEEAKAHFVQKYMAAPILPKTAPVPTAPQLPGLHSML
jgi:hypothetical protein